MGNGNSSRPLSYRIGPRSTVPELPTELWFQILGFIDFSSYTTRNKIRTAARSIKEIVDVIVTQRQITYKLKDDLIFKAIANDDLEHLKYLHSMGLKIQLRLKPAIESKCSLPFIEYLCMHGASKNFNLSHIVEQFEVLKLVKTYMPDWGYCELTIPAFYASQGDLEKLKWVREHGCTWNESTIRLAVCSGNLPVVKYCHENKCPHNSDLKFYAAYRGHLHVLEYLHEKGYPWGLALTGAVENDRVDILKWAIEHGCPTDNRTVCWTAADRGSIKCLQYAHEHGCPWDNSVLSTALLKKHTACADYARANGLTDIQDDEQDQKFEKQKNSLLPKKS